MEKYNAAALMGWTVLRYSADLIRSGVASKNLKGILEKWPDPPDSPRK